MHVLVLQCSLSRRTRKTGLTIPQKKNEIDRGDAMFNV